MAGRKATPDLDFAKAEQILRETWTEVSDASAGQPALSYLSDPQLAKAISEAVNHDQVSYRFCLPIQLLGKLANPRLDALCLQKKDDAGWDARSLGSRVVAAFNREQECVLGSSGDPYVGNPMRIPRMIRDDPSKKDIQGWNRLVDVLEAVEQRNDPEFTRAVFRQVLLNIFRRQQGQRFTYPIPPRTSLEDTLRIAREFLTNERSGGDRALALAGALFDVIGSHFKLYSEVRRGRINASDDATGLAGDLECLDGTGSALLVVEVKDRQLSLTDLEATLRKSRERSIRDVLFTVPGVESSDNDQVTERLARAFASGQNIYVFDFLDLAHVVLALGGEPMRNAFLTKVGEHLDVWNTQPRHRQAWKQLLEMI